jgi:hypothetical protein
VGRGGSKPATLGSGGAAALSRSALTPPASAWKNERMGRLSLYSCAAGIAVSLVVSPTSASAQGRATSTLSVIARVAALCTVTVDETVASSDRSPAVRVACSRSGLRALRVTTNRGDSIELSTTFLGVERRAGGEVEFFVPVVLATLASTRPATAPVPPLDRAPVTVTLDF